MRGDVDVDTRRSRGERRLIDVGEDPLLDDDRRGREQPP